jgi:hypothetical protein
MIKVLDHNWNDAFLDQVSLKITICLSVIHENSNTRVSLGVDIEV